VLVALLLHQRNPLIHGADAAPKTASHSVVIVVIATIVISGKGGCGGRFTYIPGSILAGDLEFEGGRLDIGL
jgi:hypothetical protein